ncbi:acyl-CoA thioesterase [Euzebya sp.]|uniref:acyl-CoA thioesterase n=1 Tax=Euzebya sp. TaxID=1971409 RepID=UPI003514FAED
MSTDLDLADPSTYDFFTEENVRFSDTDMVGHVNNVAHTALVECGRIAFGYEMARRSGVEFGTITFAHLDIDFRADLYYPARVRIGCRVLRVGTSSFTVGVGVFDGDTCATTSTNVLVHLGEDRRPAPLPDAFREVLSADLSGRGPSRGPEGRPSR